MKALQSLGQGRLGRKKKKRANKREEQEQVESLLSEDSGVMESEGQEEEELTASAASEESLGGSYEHVASPGPESPPSAARNPSTDDQNSPEGSSDDAVDVGTAPNVKQEDIGSGATEETISAVASENEPFVTIQQVQDQQNPDTAAASVKSFTSPRSVRFAAALVEEKSITEVSYSPNLSAQPAHSILLNSRLQALRHTPLENMSNTDNLDDHDEEMGSSRDDSFDDVSWGSSSPETKSKHANQSSFQKGTRSPVGQGAKAKRNLRKLALHSDEEQGLNISEDVTSLPEKPIHSSRQDIFKEVICGRKWCAIVFLSFLFTLLIARSVGKSSKSSLSTSTAEERDNPLRHAAEDEIKKLRALLRTRPKPIIITTLGGNSEGLDVVAAVLNRLGLQIPTRINYKDFPLSTPRQSMNFKRVLERSLSPEKGLMYDERIVASEFSLTDWHIGRRFVAEYINATAYAVHEAFRSEPWAILHPRAGYLLPYIRAVLGDTDTFIFVHVTKHGFHFSKKATDEFRHLCTFIRLPGYCNADSVENRLAFWGEVNSQVKTWATTLLDVDQYYVARSEDFTNGNFECIEKLAKALKLKSDKESIEAAIAAGKSIIKTVEASDAPDDVSLPDVAQGLSEVQKILRYFGYSTDDMETLTPCKDMEWF